VDGDGLHLFNDPNCSSMAGAYRWQLDGRDLTFDVVQDPCVFGDQRSRDSRSDRGHRCPRVIGG
jgi:hypothetical protein